MGRRSLCAGRRIHPAKSAGWRRARRSKCGRKSRPASFEMTVGGSRRRDEPTLIYGYYRELLGYVEQFVNRCSVAVPRSAKMPNGWSGGFAMNWTDLKELLKAASDNAEIGKIVVHALPIRTVNAAEVIPFVEECPQDRVAVEEQGHKIYIIHPRGEPKTKRLGNGPEVPI